MHRATSSRGKFSLVAILSLGFVVLGVGLISWAAFNIWGQSVRPAVRIALEARRPVLSVLGTEPVLPSEVTTADATVFPVRPVQGQTLGILSIPALKQTFPIIEGTGTAELKKGVGHMTQTAMPGEADNCVLSGHRDTVFTRLGRLKKGQQLIVQTAGGTFTYQISRIRIVDKNDRTVVVPADHAVLTVSTCYPFDYVGDAPRRYVLSADLVGPPLP
jgi:sortase A